MQIGTRAPGLLQRIYAAFVGRLSWAFVLRYVVVLTFASLAVSHYVVWPPDTMFVLVLLLFAALGQLKAFMRYIAPFIGLFVLYSGASSIADDINPHVHYMEMVHFDRWLAAGELPTAWLQRHMWNGHVQWYDFYFYVLYTMHFFVPLMLAVFLWKRRPHLYWTYVGSISALSFAAFVTYVAFPAAPPWMSSDYGFIPRIHRISFDVWTAVGIDQPVSLYSKLSPNLVAAVPSLHSAYPLVILIFLAKAFGWRRVWWVAFYPVSLWLGIVYLGEHYVFDVIAGTSYAVIACWLTTRVVAAWRRRKSPPVPEPVIQTPERVDSPV